MTTTIATERPPLPPFTLESAQQKVRVSLAINDVPISEADRRFDWSGPRRPDDYPGLTDLGL